MEDWEVFEEQMWWDDINGKPEVEPDDDDDW